MKKNLDFPQSLSSEFFKCYLIGKSFTINPVASVIT